MKKYYVQYNIGKVKYLVNYHNGKETHKDGSEFYNIQAFRNKENMNDFITDLKKEGYTERSVFN